MVKLFVERKDHAAWQGAWACACKKQDWDGYAAQQESIVYSNAPPTDVGCAVNDVLKHMG